MTLAVAMILTYLLLVYGSYQMFTSQVPGGNDFYPRWRGTRALLWEGKNPYSAEVTLQIQNDMYGRPAREDEDQVAFAYPLYVAFLVIPLALLPYPLAQAFWSSALVLITLGAVIITLRTLDWQPSLLGLIGSALWTVFFYPTARSIILGQFSIVVLALVAMALWALKNGHQALAGCLLAWSTIKPQMIFLIVPFLLLLSVKRREYKALAAFLSVMALLLAVSWLVEPGWTRSFVEGLTSYRSYTTIYRGGTSPIGYLVGSLLPSPLSGPGTLALSLGMVACLGYAWFGAVTQRLGPSLALSLTIVVTLLLPGETGTTNQVLLLLPLIGWLSCRSRERWLGSLVFAALLVGPWLGFLCTLRGDLEHPMMVTLLPIAALLVLLWKIRPSEGGRVDANILTEVYSPQRPASDEY